MSETKPKAVVEGFLTAFANADFEKMLTFCAEDVRSIDYSAPASGIRGEYEGVLGLGQQLDRFNQALEATSFEVLDLVGEGNVWIARTRLGLRSKRNGEEYEGPMLVVYEVSDDKIVLMETLPTEPDSLYQDL